MLAETESGPAGCRSSLVLQQSIPKSESSALRAQERSHCAGGELCWPLRPPTSVQTPVLVILLGDHDGYLFLHQPQLVTQVVVSFHEVLDLCFGGRERVFHLQVLLHSDGAV